MLNQAKQNTIQGLHRMLKQLLMEQTLDCGCHKLSSYATITNRFQPENITWLLLWRFTHGRRYMYRWYGTGSHGAHFCLTSHLPLKSNGGRGKKRNMWEDERTALLIHILINHTTWAPCPPPPCASAPGMARHALRTNGAVLAPEYQVLDCKGPNRYRPPPPLAPPPWMTACHSILWGRRKQNSQNNEYDITNILTDLPIYDFPYVNKHITVIRSSLFTEMRRGIRYCVHVRIIFVTFCIIFMN